MASECKVLIVAAGEPDSIRNISPYIKGVIARDMLEVDERPEKASLLKIIGWEGFRYFPFVPMHD